MRRARKAATATSLAAFSTDGANPPSAKASRARRSEGKRPESGRSKVSGAEVREIEARGRAVDARRPAERIGDRHPHVRRAELGQHRAVAIAHHRMDHRLRMDDDLDLLRRQPEQQVRLDQLEALVHHGGRIDRDLGAHVPVGMGQRLLRRGLGHVGQRPVAERPAGRRQDQPVDGVALAAARSTWKIALCSESTGSSAPPDSRSPRSAAGRRKPAPPCWPAPPWRRGGQRPGSAQGRRSPPPQPSPIPPAATPPRPPPRGPPPPRSRCRPGHLSGPGSAAGLATTAIRARNRRACSANASTE